MQLEKLVSFHKALADHNRIRILMLLSSRQPMSGQALAQTLAVTPATITHHIGKLKQASLIYERREKNTAFYYVNATVLERSSKALLTMLEKGVEEKMTDSENLFRQRVLDAFFQDGALTRLPAQLKKKLIVLEALVAKLEKDKKYTEVELNGFIRQYYEDVATVRREFIMHGFMYRAAGVYEMNPKEMWESWQHLS
ncbi:metalloregulator ArsR/SmtB family transcription factor [Bacillaceae bacterium SIJ1]|uniref:DUF2087 domain-containing protein n=1 Tax=Litoribacterium kuwaitense TaxID=1398745 RepID=UPI0013EB9549|nr:metalloregulator ArsR/SmtB family transcription factor [Litoribacterium kuwaitense]NGP44885.1 metalloregulator ArsR/SmtB family transcription factor [Litoribacterium kuwaitense]